jgi:putative tricarboxylic transport membrane protein
VSGPGPQLLVRSRDARAGVVAAVLGGVYLAAAFWIEPDPSSTSVVGPRAAPMVIGAATLVCAVALVVQALRSPARADGDGSDRTGQPESEESQGESRRLSQRQVLVVSAIFAAYVVAFIPLGYLLSTFLFLVGLTTYVDRDKLPRNCLYAAVFSSLVYVLFNYGLQVQLPSPGLLG